MADAREAAKAEAERDRVAVFGVVPNDARAFVAADLSGFRAGFDAAWKARGEADADLADSHGHHWSGSGATAAFGIAEAIRALDEGGQTNGR